ncbi:MAG TPA: HDOD domain-containing protein, partial [Rhodocyclaceae bacterium]|nr:HDOD domain-containing protein [Rhodocyclaceae bacterium]
MSTPSADDDKVGDALNAQRFQMLEDIAKELAGEIVFPTYFDAALRLRKALQDTDQPLARIVAAISLEPLIAAKLMKLANSALYGGSSAAVRDLGSAIQRLGLETVRTTALAIAMGQMLRSKEMAPFSDLTRQLWDHTLKTAVAARLLAKSHTRLNPDEALLAGLVHDLGAFYMLYRAAQYAELRARPETVKYLIVQWHEGIGVSLLNALG